MEYGGSREAGKEKSEKTRKLQALSVSPRSGRINAPSSGFSILL